MTRTSHRIALVAITRQGASQAEALAARLASRGSGAQIVVADKFAGPMASVAGLSNRVIAYQGTLSDQIGGLFSGYDQIVFFVSLGAVTRLIAPHLKSKQRDPGVLVVDEAGRFVIPVLSGHVGGANAFAEYLAALLGATPVITTASDVGRTLAVDILGRELGWRLEAPGINVTRVSAHVVNGEPVALVQEAGARNWWHRETPLPANIRLFERLEEVDPQAFRALLWVSHRQIPPSLWQGFKENLVVYRPPLERHDRPPRPAGSGFSPRGEQARMGEHARLPVQGGDGRPRRGSAKGSGSWGASPGIKVILGLGCDRGASLETLEEAVNQALASVNLSPRAVATIATIDKKRDEAAILSLAARHGWPLRLFGAEALAQVPVPNPSETVRAHMGTPAVAEAAALLAANTHMADLLLTKFKYLGRDGKNATVSIARRRAHD
jgi:cobalt-precorrin 5A hydrolase